MAYWILAEFCQDKATFFFFIQSTWFSFERMFTEQSSLPHQSVYPWYFHLCGFLFNTCLNHKTSTPLSECNYWEHFLEWNVSQVHARHATEPFLCSPAQFSGIPLCCFLIFMFLFQQRREVQSFLWPREHTLWGSRTSSLLSTFDQFTAHQSILLSPTWVFEDSSCFFSLVYFDLVLEGSPQASNGSKTWQQPVGLLD